MSLAFLIRYGPSILAAAAIAGAVWYVMALRADNAALEAENGRLVASLATCSARIRNIQEDKASDATVGNPSDFPVPDSWMRP